MRVVRVLSAVVIAAGLLAATAAVLAPSAPAMAEDEVGGQGNGFLNPFPPGDVYALQTVGDTFAEGLADALGETMTADSRVRVARKHRPLDALMRNDFETVSKDIDAALAKEPLQIAVIMLGASDRIPWRPQGGKRIAVGSDEWRAEFGRRVERLMRIYKSHSVAVYWVGLPLLRDSDASDDAQMMNDIIRERAVVNGVRYVDSYQALADEQGGYTEKGPDITGNVRVLRERDGVNFTAAGNRKLAHFVEKELRRDLAQAKQDRNIPLAGAPTEQAKINAAAKAEEAARAAQTAAAAKPAAATGGPSGAGPGPAAGGTNGGMAGAGLPGAGAMGGGMQAPASGLSDLKADTARINLKTLHGGKEELVAIDIVRPALPASVIAAVTRKESADKPSQMGESLIDQIAGGITVVSSITPANEAGSARRKLSPTQSPYFRVLVKGERVTPKAGRADELVWPRPEPPAFVAEAPKTAARPAPAPERAPAVKEDDGDKPQKRGRRRNG